MGKPPIIVQVRLMNYITENAVYLFNFPALCEK